MKLVKRKKDNLNQKKPTRRSEGALPKEARSSAGKAGSSSVPFTESLFCVLERARAGPRRARAGYARILT